MFVGQASAIGLTIEILILIKSLAERLLSSNTDFLSFEPGSKLLSALYAGVDNNIVPTGLVKTYSLNWWDKKNVSSTLA
jgi:hypothetical protein